ncbi:uncharacterized protein B0H18DRAFT_1120860 [Fomitopsis serialis]|uniref:uncharacterized protein n=1 Tax=Fomitopsis serialis TaxID=139415 RepID=UPI00200895A0|nr:uncharacterized protein B0H18DRAFT_1120860 [Neoantrodia serialis]KAH9922467.1 hypothetical protein B0H18DRAFT_1120860 [Neoantrodia serialis]
MADSAASLIQEDRLLNNLVLAAQALCCYDYCITFASEVKYVWSRKFSLAAALFYAFRYAAVLNTLFIADDGCASIVLVFDGFVFGMTWWGTRRATALGGSRAVLMRDTAIYFGFLFALNVLAIAIAAVHLTFIVVVNTWTAILTSVLLSRLMLDLREVIADLIPSDTSRHTFRSGSTSLSRTLGSLHFTQRGAAPPSEISIELSPVSPRAGRRRGDSEGESWTLGGDESEG